MSRRAVQLLTAILSVILLLPGRVGAYGSDGVHIVVLEDAGDSAYEVSEFIDNGLISCVFSTVPGEASVISGSLKSENDDKFSASILSAESKPLVVFMAEHVEDFEEAIIRFTTSERERKLRQEYTNQLLGGIFQVPLWPYLAVSEIPLMGIDVTRGYALPYERSEQFPSVNYLRGSDGITFETGHIADNRVEVYAAGGAGEGRGVVLRYNLIAEPEQLEISPFSNDGVLVIYSNTGLKWVVPGNFTEIGMSEMVNLLDGETVLDAEKGYISQVEVGLDSDALTRAVIYQGAEISGVFKPETAESQVKGQEVSAITPIILIMVVWMIFAVLLTVINYIFKFSVHNAVALTLRGLAVYPLYLAGSLFFSGFLGMGYLPAAVLASRFISRDGRRIAATGAVLGASLIVTLIIFYIIR